MSYTLRRTWPRSDHRANDFVVRFKRHDVGRLYLATLPSGNRWRWSIYITNKVRVVPGVAIDGVADDPETAKRDCAASFEKMRRTLSVRLAESSRRQA